MEQEKDSKTAEVFRMYMYMYNACGYILPRYNSPRAHTLYIYLRCARRPSECAALLPCVLRPSLDWLYRRAGFDCVYLLNAKCEFF